MTKSALIVIAHRGASSYAPENTFAAFDLAVKIGVSHIELDVHLSSDGHVVVIHDDTVDRTSNAQGAVTSYSWSELKALDVGSWFEPQFSGEQIPSLDDVLVRYKGQVHFHIEIKGESAELSKRTVDVIRAHHMESQVTITSFQKERLEEVRSYAPELSTAWLVTMVRKSVIKQAKDLGVNQLCPLANLVTTKLVQRIYDEELMVRVWGVKTEKLMKKVVYAGADGMTVNFPDKLITFLKNKNLKWL